MPGVNKEKHLAALACLEKCEAQHLGGKSIFFARTSSEAEI
ncbi:MAG: hypothetical protein ACI8PB_002989 [Desulforhopalus sp.]|jgi:hypothetical protein